MALEQTANNQMMSNNTGNNASDKADVGITHDARVRVFPTHHKEIQVSKNVQSDLDMPKFVNMINGRRTKVLPKSYPRNSSKK